MKVKVGMDPATDIAAGARGAGGGRSRTSCSGSTPTAAGVPVAAVQVLPQLEELGIAFVEQPVAGGRSALAGAGPGGGQGADHRRREPLHRSRCALADRQRCGGCVLDLRGDGRRDPGRGGGGDGCRCGAPAMHDRQQPGAWDRPGGDDPPRDLATGDPAGRDSLRHHQPLLLRAATSCGNRCRSKRGVAHRIDKPGLGVELDIEAIERYRVS